jgi:hypothetical protein
VTRATRKRSCKDLPVEAMTLAAMLAALDRPGKLSATRLRDLQLAVKRVANLLIGSTVPRFRIPPSPPASPRPSFSAALQARRS